MFINATFQIQEFSKVVKVLENKRKPDCGYRKVQKIILAEKWFPILESFLKEVVEEGFICIPMHNLLEAAVYSRVKPTIQFLKPENKCNALIGMYVWYNN